MATTNNIVMEAPPGLKLSYFHRFIDLHGGREVFRGLTTAQVCFKYVVPFTKSSKLSLVDHVKLQQDDAHYVDNANWYVSHAWLYNFLEALDSLESFFNEQFIDDPVVWFCVFNNNQHQAHEYPFEWWQSTFKDSLAAIGNVVMIMHPWKNPITLTRSWCVFEVYVSICVGAAFHIAMSPNQEDIFLKDMIEDVQTFYNMLGSVNSEKANATVPTDKESIDAVIIREVGFINLDRLVFDTFEAWMIRTIHEHIQMSKDPLDTAKYNFAMADFYAMRTEFHEAEIFCKNAYEIYLEELGPKDFKTCEAQAQLGVIYGYQNRPIDQWEPILKEAIAKLTDVAGEDDVITLTATYHLAYFYYNLDMKNECLDIWKTSLDLFAQHFGDSEKRMIVIMSGIGLLTVSMENFEMAEQYLTECYNKLCITLGPENPTTLSILGHLALVYLNHEKYDLALTLGLQVFESRQRTLGLYNRYTIYALFNLALAYHGIGEYDEAAMHSLTALEAGAVNCSDDSIITNILDLLGKIYFNAEDCATSIEYFELAIAGWEMFGNKENMKGCMTYMYPCYQRLNSIKTIDEVIRVENWCKSVGFWNEARNSIKCTLCEIPELFGVYYVCPTCSIGHMTVCQSCFSVMPQCIECEIIDLVESLPPPRYLLKLKANILEELGRYKEIQTTLAELHDYYNNMIDGEMMSSSILSCSIENAKHMHTLLSSLLLGRKKDQLIRCDIDPSGLYFTAHSKGKALQIKTSMTNDLFESFDYSISEATSFRISLNHLLDGLSVFGQSAMACTAVTCSYDATDGVFNLVLTEDGVLAECSIKTMVDDDHNDFSHSVFERNFETSKIVGSIIMTSQTLWDACSEFNELPTGAAVEVIMYPNSSENHGICLKMQSTTPTSCSEMELGNDSTAIVQAQVEAIIASSFQWSLLQAGLQVLPVAAESYFRLNAQGFCSIQHMLLIGSHRAFVDILLCPDAS
ncbi:mbre TPR repeat protein [Thraustotheca clavata]|uniref:Mbre TPR repeat protein n=1 Tax=Thraustotheca clavata TaxID=74557 RepID=A0A1V9ZJY6_9STRA|nr:mbre TPR repeat protein [Thraustotheca clavata]